MDIFVKDGTLFIGDHQFKCALGRSGVSENKKEGDGATPAGTFPIRKVFYRADKVERPKSVFETEAISNNDGWCDDPGDKNYNRYIVFPCSASAEHLWRRDDIYDVIVVLGYNDEPIIPGKGSAIFMHVARPDYSPTEGCIALSRADLLEVLKLADANTQIHIELAKVGNVSN